MEKNAKKLAKSAEKLPNGKKLADNLGRLLEFAESAEGKRLIASLGKSGTDNVERAAQALNSGKTDAAAAMLKTLLSTPEGRELVKKIAGITGI